MTDKDTRTDQKDFQDRLRKARELETQRKAGPPPSELSGATGLGAAFRIGTELVAGVVVGVMIGYVLDHWFGTKPWMLIVFFFLGSGAGILNVYRAASGIGATPETEDRGKTGNRDFGDTDGRDPPKGQ